MIKSLIISIAFLTIGCSGEVVINDTPLMCENKNTIGENNTGIHLSYMSKYGVERGTKLFHKSIHCIVLPKNSKVKILKQEKKYTKISTTKNGQGWIQTEWLK